MCHAPTFFQSHTSNATMARSLIFKFKQFQVEHSRAAMKVGTDAVLLGAWCGVQGVRRALDVGTGCGVIALMVAQRAPEARVTAIDIDPEAVAEAADNFAASPWSDRLSARQCDFKQFAPGTEEKYDLIVSNPPYFMNGVLPSGDSRTMARHTTELTYRQLLDGAKLLLDSNGRLAIVAPADCESQVLEDCAWCGYSPLRITEVAPVDGAAPKRLLWELVPRQGVETERTQLAIEHSPLNYTDEYRRLCRDFYLKF